MTNTQDNSIYRTGDLVIGSSDPSKSVYSATGAKLIDSGVAIYGNEDDLNSQYKDLVRSATMSGGKPLGISADKKRTTKKSKKQKATLVSFENLHNFTTLEHQEPQKPNPIKPSTRITSNPQTVQFENDFGKIKVRVETLIEHEQAYLLVFIDEASIIFEPKVGELLKFHTQNSVEEVYYPGVIFNSPQDDARFMILFKVPEENQE